MRFLARLAASLLVLGASTAAAADSRSDLGAA